MSAARIKSASLRHSVSDPTTDIRDLFDCEVVISMLPDDDAVREIVFGRRNTDLDGLAAGLKPGAIHLSMSTISTAAASLLASEHARNGQGYVAAPVFGNPDAAKARQLFIVAAGAAADIERCQPILDSLGQKTFVIGTDPGDANLVKLLGNMMSATALEMLGEVVAVIRKRGTGSAAIHRHHDEHDVRRTRAQNLWRQDCKSDLRARLCLAARAQGCASGARGGGEGGRSDAIGRAWSGIG